MSFRFVSLLLATTALSGLPALAQQLPTGGSVAAGSVNIGTAAAGQMNITQSSSSAVVNWQTFSVGQGGRVNIAQPSSTAALLNRVTGSATSVIAGQINANGQVYLVNPNGIAITPTGSVAAAGYVGSSLDIGTEAFMSGARSFHGNGQSAAVTNAGSIAVSEGGFAALIGGEVENSGTITVPAGKVGLASGEQVTLDFTGDGFLQVAVPTQGGDSGRALVRQSGVIRARDGVVELRAATARDALREAINMSGVIAARGISQDKGGTVILDGGEGGTTRVSGRIVTTAKSNKTTAASTKTGGRIDILGRNVALSGAKLDASGSAGGGTIRVGGSKGGIGALPNADRVSADSSSVLRSDAIQSGNGGTIIVWSNSATAFAGRLSATGGQASGNGGFAEVSSKGLLSFTGRIDLTAPQGTPGTLLLDPYDVVISGDSGSDISNGDFSATSTSVINVATLQTALANGSVQISTGASDSAGTGGTITVASNLTWLGRGTNLTLTAAKGIVIGATVTDGSLGTLTLTAGDSYGLTFTNGGKIDLPTNFAATGLPASHLTINGTNYTLVNSMDGLAALQGSSGSFAIASDLASSQAYTSSVIATFQGRLEGLGHKISNLTINATAPTLGLIGSATGATISNLTLDGGSVINNFTGSASNTGTGTLIGSGTNNSVTDVTSSVDVAGGTTKTGGLIGYANDTNISFASTSGAVNGFEMVGGLIGSFAASSEAVVITDSSSSSNVVGSGRFVGGLIGFASWGTVQHSQASGPVSGARGVGGLIGSGVSDLTLSDTHAYGPVTGIAATGGLAGALLNVTVSDSGSEGLVQQANATSTSNSSFGGLVGTLSNGALKNVYSLSNVEAPAVLQVGGLVGVLFGGSIDSSSASGAVVGASRVGGLVGYQTSSGTISNSSATGMVSGTSSIGGLVGLLAGGAVTNVSASGSVIEAMPGSGFGGLIGVASGGSIVSNGSSTSEVSAPNSTEVGGLIGSATNTNISGSQAGGNVTGTMNVGGLVGFYTNTGTAPNYSITGSTSSGDVVGTTSVGGLVGYFQNIGASLTLDSSSATGHVTGTNGVGGLVGLLEAATVSNSNASGAVQQNADGQSFGGLIGGANDSRVSNSFSTGNVTAAGSTDVGGLIGTASDITISGTHAAGSVIGLTNVGGLMGSFYGVNQVPALQNSWASGDTIGNSSVGGLIGLASDVAISGTYAIGNVTGQLYVGGLLGSFSQAVYATNVTDSWASGATTGSSYVGGLIGTMSQVSVANSHAMGSVQQNAPGDSFGGLIGYANSGTVSNSDSSGNVTAADSSNVGGLIGSTTDVTIAGSHAAGSVIGQSNVGGLLGSFVPANGVPQLTDSWASGDTTGGTNVGGLIGSVDSAIIARTFAIGNVTGQSYVGGLLGSFVRSLNNSSLTDSWASGTTTGISTVGGLIGSSGQVSVANSHAIGAVRQNAAGFSFGGLIGTANGGSISNSYSTGAVSAADSSGIGGLVGTANDLTVTSSHATGKVIGKDDTGGLLGDLVNGNGMLQVTDSWASGNVLGADRVGGLIGTGFMIDVERSYALGLVTGNSSVGGLFGDFENGQLTNTYATGAVTGNSSVGGLIGSMDSSTLTRSFSAGRVLQAGAGSQFGGLIGSVSNSVLVQDYSSSPVLASDSDQVGGLLGWASATSIREAYASGAVKGATNVGPIMGAADDGVTVQSTYWDVASSGLATSSFGLPLTRGVLPSDFDATVWGVVDGVSNPYFLSSFSGTPVAITGSLRTMSGTGSTDVEGLTLSATNGTSTYSNTGSSGADGQYVILADPTIGQASWSVALSGSSGSVRLLQDVAPVTRDIALVTGAFTYASQASTYDALASEAAGVGTTLLNNFGFDVSGRAKAYFVTGDLTMGDVSENTSLYVRAGGSITVNGQVAVNGTATLIAAQNFLLNEDTTVQAQSPLVAALNGYFENAGGAQAIQATSGSWLVYAKNAADSSFNALWSNNVPLASVSYEAATSAGVGGNLYAFGSKLPLQATPRALSKTYGDTAALDPARDIVFTNLNADAYPVNPTANLTATIISSGNSATALVGQYDLQLDLSSSNYQFATDVGTLNVTARPITVIADNASRTYGDANPALTWQITSGNLVNGDGLSGALTTSAGLTSNVGGYTISAAGLAASTNYALTSKDGTLAITPRSITVTADNASRTYGDANPALTWKIISGNLVNGDGLSGALTTSAGLTSNVGGYTISAAGLAASANYALTRKDGTLAVTARPIQIAATDVSKVIGTADPELPYSLQAGAGLVNGDSFNLRRATGETVGAYAIGLGTFAKAADYLITFTSGTFTILQGPVTGASNLLTSSTSSIDSVILPSVSTISMAPAMLSINSATFAALDGENVPGEATLTTETSDTTDTFLVYQSGRHAADGSCLHLNLCLTPSR